jgi:protein gp37
MAGCGSLSGKARRVSKTTISWTEETWNPLGARNIETGKEGWACVRVSIECLNCYADGLNQKTGVSGETGLPYKPGHIGQDVELFIHEDRLREPMSWRKPKIVFVCSMTDVFWELYSEQWIDQVFAAIALAPRQTFQVLTKRHVRMYAYMTDPETPGRIARAAEAITGQAQPLPTWPLPNVWLGVSAGTQMYANQRIPTLLTTAAVVHWVSAEPLLEAVSLARWLQGDCRLDWIVVGGESLPIGGKKADIRPMAPGH